MNLSSQERAVSHQHAQEKCSEDLERQQESMAACAAGGAVGGKGFTQQFVVGDLVPCRDDCFLLQIG